MSLAFAVAAAPSGALAAHETLACASCHSLRAPGGPVPRAGGDDTTLCLQCHDGRADVPDALGGASASERPAGGLSRVGDGPAKGDTTYGEDTGHTLGSRDPPPGFDRTWTGQLGCRSCHAAHPNGNYRNLGPDPYLRGPEGDFTRQLFSGVPMPLARSAPGAQAADVAPDADVLVPDPELAPDPANAPVLVARAQDSALDRFCAACHPRLHGAARTSSASGGFARHPTGGVTITGRTRDALLASAELPRVTWSSAREAYVSCLTCHRAHGSRHPYGLVWWSRDARRNGEDGAGRSMESLCLTCHRVDAAWPLAAAAR
jgi:hypothetical protein